MSQPLMFSEFSSNENLSNNRNNNSKEGFIGRKRKTIKRREGFDNNNNNNSPSKVEKMKQMLQPLDDEDDDGDNLANFNQEFTPPEQPVSAGVERMDSRDIENGEQQEPAKENDTSYSPSDPSVGVEGYNGMTEGYTEQYVNQFVPYYQNAANVSTSNNNSEITEKLNYLIHLIEDQKDEKVGHVTEELILYSFLGVFVIYIVDSFARVGKYVR